MSNITKDFKYCMSKHTLNLDGSRGAYGDVVVAKCMAERAIERASEGAANNSKTSDSRKIYTHDGRLLSRDGRTYEAGMAPRRTSGDSR